METKHFIRPALAAAIALLIPLFADFPWSTGDFVAMGALIYGAGLTFEFIASKKSDMAYRLAVALAVGTAFVLTWGNLAVGLIGEDNPANTFYFGVPIVGLIGAIAAGFRPRGMANAAFAMAAAQIAIYVAALIFWNYDFAPGAAKLLGFNSFFAAMFIGAGLLFRQTGNTSARLA